MFATAFTRTPLTSVLLLSLLSIFLQPPRALVHAITKEELCRIRCERGLGGNLCQCNAFHFSGKRSDLGRDLAAGGPASSHDVDALSPLAELALSKDRDSSSFRASRLVVGGEPASGFRGEGSRAVVPDDDNDRLVVERFFGVEGPEKSAVRRLAVLIKAAIDERLTDSRRTLRRSSQFGSDGAMY